MLCSRRHPRAAPCNTAVGFLVRLFLTLNVFQEMTNATMAYIHPDPTFTRSTVPSPNRRIDTSGIVKSALCSTTSNDNEQKTDKDDDAVLTDVDARVLQAMLAEDKLNLDEEENLKQLLERGIRAKEPAQRPVDESEEPSEYKSTALKKLTNTKLWKALRRNADDFIESATIFVSNRIERDAKLLGALGLFAFERAMKDVSRALPATASTAAKKVLRLGNTTSYQPPQSKQGGDGGMDQELLQDMTTPMDEIKSVSEDLKQIFKSGGSVAGATSRRGLKSTAPAGMANSRERFAQAYKRKQQTTLKKEKENVVQKGGRAVSGVVDIGWELKRELEVEPNKAGYRTKALREGAMKTAGQLKAGASRILEAAKRKDKDFQLESSTSASTIPMEEEKKLKNAAATAKPSASFAFATIPELHQFMKQEQRSLIQRLTECVDEPSETWLKTDLLTTEEVEKLDASVVEPVINALVKAQKILELEQEDEELHLVDPGLPSSVVTHQLLISLQEGKEWIDRVLQAAKDTGSTTIVALLEMKLLDMNEDRPELPVYLRLEQLERQANELEAYEKEQATAAAATAATTTPVQGSEGEKKKSPFDLSFFATPDTSSVEDEKTEMNPPPFNTVPMKNTDNDVEDIDYTTSKYVDVIAESSQDAWSPPSQSRAQGDWTVEAQVVRDDSMLDASTYVSTGTPMDPSSFAAELVSDDDFEDAVGEFKAAVAAFDEDEEDKEPEKPNPLVQLSLRSFDILFFIVEKTLVGNCPMPHINKYLEFLNCLSLSVLSTSSPVLHSESS